MRAVRRQLDEDERIAWLRLARTPNIGPSTFAALLHEFGGIHEALQAAPSLARRGGKELKIAGAELAERELDAVNELSGRHPGLYGAGISASARSDRPAASRHNCSRPYGRIGRCSEAGNRSDRRRAERLGAWN